MQDHDGAFAAQLRTQQGGALVGSVRYLGGGRAGYAFSELPDSRLFNEKCIRDS